MVIDDEFSDITMQDQEEDCSWEEVYNLYGVRSDIDDEVSSLGEKGVCPTPFANPFHASDKKVLSWMRRNGIRFDAYA